MRSKDINRITSPEYAGAPQKKYLKFALFV